MDIIVMHEFNAEQWADGHEKLCTQRFEEVREGLKTIWKLFGVAGMAILSLLAWSLQTQYAQATAQLDAIHKLSAQVSTVAK